MAWTVIVIAQRRADGSTETHYAHTLSNEVSARFHADAIRSLVDPSVEIVIEEVGPFSYTAVPCLICGGDIEAHDTGIICPECALWAVAIENAAKPRWLVVAIAARQERRARL